MKAITIFGLAPDNAGNYHDAGATLIVDDAADKGCITAERASHLVSIGSASASEDTAEGPDTKAGNKK